MKKNIRPSSASYLPPAATNPRRTPKRRHRRMIAGLSLLVTVGVVGAILLATGCGGPAPETTGSSATPGLTSGTPTPGESTTLPSSGGETQPAAGGDAAHPLSLDLSARKEIPIPSPFSEAGWELVRILPDGSMVMNSGSRLSVYDPASGVETVVEEAEFGIQAAAGDRHLAYGVGGDEYLDIRLHYIGQDYTETILSDPDGFLDLEMTRSGGLLASRIRYTGEEAGLDAWLRYDIASGQVTEIPTGERNFAHYLLFRAHPDKNPNWTYDVGVAWHQAWLDGGEQLYYAEIVRQARDDYACRLYRSDTTGGELLFMTDSGPLPDIEVSQHLIRTGDWLACVVDTGRWVSVPFSDPAYAESFPHGARVLSANPDGVLVAALARFGRATRLYLVPAPGVV